MGGRQYPWVLASVPWSDATAFTRGTHLGLPLVSWGIAPRDLVATRRQLRAMGLRPNGQEPVAYLYFYCRRAGKKVFAELFLISKSAPHRPATPAQHTAIAKANLAKRICRTCGRDAGYVVPLETRQCTDCWLAEQSTPEPMAA
ncbi:hypothetical protein LV75_000657 [Actinokineospora diospyrosa]|uniref:Uncharacterized protein n=1 Tax=Actinokineospora diospyrosa TaxID=103728 RepID=A0ABT1I6Z7_9PSEU|nr:hypothetical protein [Actinokineospora diospyrosa]